MENKYIMRAGKILGVISVIILLYITSIYNYIMFHTIAEMFCICIAFTVFVLTWNSYKYLENNYLIIIGVSMFFIGIINLFHVMSSEGMNIFSDLSKCPCRLWICVRYFESIVLLLPFAFIKLKKKVNIYIVFTICAFITTIFLLSVFVWKILSADYLCKIDFNLIEKYSKYIICLMLIAAIAMLIYSKNNFESKIYEYVLFSILLLLLSEISLDIYSGSSKLLIVIGHFFKLLSFYFVYKCIIVKGIKEPYETIFIEMKLTEEKLNEQNKILKNLSEIDGLTGLYNHKHIYELLEKKADIYKIKEHSFSILLLDIDYFKNINDTYGHVIGDSILKEIAVVIKESISELDFAGRYGGEEFLVMINETSSCRGIHIAESIRRAIEFKEFTNGIHLTVSIGIQSYNGETITFFIEKADKKLYKSKKSGRNRVTI